MCLIGALPWVRGMLLFAVQLLGGITASALVACMFPGPLNVETSLGGGTSITQGLFIEMMLTTQLVFTIFMLAAEKHKGTFIAPVGIGLSLFVAELTGTFLPTFHRRTLTDWSLFRRLLHRRITKPSPVLRSCSCKSPLRRLPLDLLARPYPWSNSRVGLLQIHQGSRIRDCKPRPRLPG
jgi:hypothetical protein